MIFKLKQYAKQIGSAKVYNFISKAEDEMNSLSFKCCKQTVIPDFLEERSES